MTFSESTVGLRMVTIEPGSFSMGQPDGELDERPVHEVAITTRLQIAATQVSNAQYEAFDPGHRRLRGSTLSRDHDEAVVNVSWFDAMRYCSWLSRREGRPYRLPTEAEWEYCCRAGTTTKFHTGDDLPVVYHRWQEGYGPQGDFARRCLPPEQLEWAFDLRVGQTPPNAWGLCDMHGNVEEWCWDWYGPYPAERQADPAGCADGMFKVTRGGSFATPVEFLRSANRSAALPADLHSKIGFRVVCAPEPTRVTAARRAERWAADVSQRRRLWSARAGRAQLRAPRVYVRIPETPTAHLYTTHNHFPSVVACPNGDLLATWFTCTGDPHKGESGRRLSIAASRLRCGADQWDEASSFFAAADRNCHSSALFRDARGRIFHFQGVGSDDYQTKQVLVLRISDDNGASWSSPRIINARRSMWNPHMVIRTSRGTLIVTSDYNMENTGLWGRTIVSHDDGGTWHEPSGLILGQHPAVVELADGSLMSVGRDNWDPRHPGCVGAGLPLSISEDCGETWTYRREPALGGGISWGQRPVLMRLNEGVLLYIGFTEPKTSPGTHGIDVTDASGRRRMVYGMFSALSDDEGRTWHHHKLLTPGGSAREYDGGGNTGRFLANASFAEPGGYLTATQAPDGAIHLLSSLLHYELDLQYLMSPTVSAEA